MRFSFVAMNSPIALHSSAVVRINVTFALCLTRLRSLNFGGTVSNAQKLAMSSAPHEPTYGIGRRANASKRSGPALSTPPTISSHTSVVEMSSTPASRPESTSFSIDWPPVPVAWNTRQSNSFCSCLVTACTHGVVTPNIVSPIAGFSRMSPCACTRSCRPAHARHSTALSR